MRSILKSHRRSTSGELQPPFEFSKKNTNKPSGSPVTQYASSMTPPPSATYPSLLSSPKKLLTPIKKMFGHHQKSQGPLAPADAPYSVSATDYAPPRRPHFTRNADTSSSTANRGSDDFASNSCASPSLFLLEPMPTAPPEPVGGKRMEFGITLLEEKVAPEHPQNDPMPIIPKIMSPRSPTPSAELPPSTAQEVANNPDAEDFYEADNDNGESDSSSQFSFVKGLSGGRNTSVKYYKTRSSTKKMAPSDNQNYINYEDMGFEDDDISGYDFENNGVDEEDVDDEGPDASNRYNDFLSDERSKSGALCDSFSPSKNEASKYSVVDSLQNLILLTSRTSDCSKPTLDPIDTGPCHMDTGPLSPGYDDIFIDAYLSSSRLPLLEHTSSADSHNARDSISQEIENDASGEHSTLVECQPPPTLKRGSIVNMMDTLLMLEETSPAPTGPEPNTKETTKAEKGRSEDKSHRQSIADMMSTLSFLAEHNVNDDTTKKTASEPRPDISTPTSSKSQYPWLAPDEEYLVDSSIHSTEHHSDSALDQDLLDEINMLPEDYDLSNLDLHNVIAAELGFLRSNSFTKKPRKHIVDYSPQKNKIETSNKTVTFYRSNSLDKDYGRRTTENHVIQRSDHDQKKDHSCRLRSGLCNVMSVSTSDLGSQKSFSLEPITELKSPQLN